jgi:hypothetical protein
MKEKILIIEDDFSDYQEIINEIGGDKFDFLPTPDNYVQMQDAFNLGTLKEFVRGLIQQNYDTITVILCDLVFEGSHPDNENGSRIIKFIRNDIVIAENKLFPKFVPIIAYTNYSNGKLAEQALLYRANINIQKGTNRHLKTLVEGYADSFKDLDSNNLSIDKVNQEIKIGFDSTIIRLNEVLEQNNKQFEMLINALFSIMNKDKKEQFYERFKVNIEDYLSDKEKQKLNQSLWDEIKLAFVEFNSDGGGKQLADTICEILDNAGFLGTKGRIIAAGVKGIAGFISMLKVD